jgi:phage regulator Rha-like protein
VKDLIKKILKEEFDGTFDWVNEIPQITPAEEFLYDLMSSLTIVESKKWKNWMTYKDKNGKILMADNINTGTERPKLYVDYTQIWEKLEGYGLKKEEIKALCVRMLEVTHKRKVFTAFSI